MHASPERIASSKEGLLRKDEAVLDLCERLDSQNRALRVEFPEVGVLLKPPSLGDRVARISQIAYLIAAAEGGAPSPETVAAQAIWIGAHRLFPAGGPVAAEMGSSQRSACEAALLKLGEAGEFVLAAWRSVHFGNTAESELIRDAALLDRLLFTALKQSSSGVSDKEPPAAVIARLSTPAARALGEVILNEDPHLWWQADEPAGNPMVRFFHELGFLGTEARRGWRKLGITGFDSVQEHSLSMAQMASLLCHASHRTDGPAVVACCLWHDIHETRTGDPDSLMKRYSSLDAVRASTDQCRPLGTAGQRVLESWHAVEDRSTPAGSFCKDIDRLEMAFAAAELMRNGIKQARVWFDWVEAQLHSPAANDLYCGLKARLFHANGAPK